MRRRMGYLSNEDRARQAEAFARMYARRRSGDWRAEFERWADSKDFSPHDRWAIEQVTDEIMLADGTAVFTDPLAALWMTPPEDAA